METSTSSLFFSSTTIFCVLNLVIVTVIITSRLKFQNRAEGGPQRPQFSGQEDAVNNSPPDQPPLVRTNSVLERVKSFIYPDSDRPDDPNELQEQKVDEMRADLHEMRRSKSETTSNREAPAAACMKKSASEKAAVAVLQEEDRVDRREAAATTKQKKKKERFSNEEEEEEEKKTTPLKEDEGVDEKADNFIKRFRQNLKLQRMDSILRYREMLSGGVGR